jgi:hypothetical protein
MQNFKFEMTFALISSVPAMKYEDMLIPDPRLKCVFLPSLKLSRAVLCLKIQENVP